MAFKTVKSYNEEKFGGYFLLRNDGDYADVIFLYQGVEDVLVADVHYIKSPEYSGYVHCCERGCPACAKGIRTQTKLFIPLYNIADNEVQFFDRTMRFEPQLQQDVFAKYPNPSEYVFRITRHGAAGDVNTTYEIVAVGRNSYKTYSQILVETNMSMEQHYATICKPVTIDELHGLLVNGDRPSNGYSPNDAYVPTPRQAAAPVPNLPDPGPIDIPNYSEAPSMDSPQTAALLSDNNLNNDVDSTSDELDEKVDF